MSARIHRATGLLLCLAACATHREQAPAVRAASSSDAAAESAADRAPAALLSPFHLAVIEESLAYAVRPTRTRGRTLLVGQSTVLVSGDDGVDLAPEVTRATAPGDARTPADEPGGSPENRTIDDSATVDGWSFRLVRTENPNRLVAELRRPDASTWERTRIAPRAATGRLWVNMPRDVVAYGASTHADEKPVLSQFDGARWAPLEAPPGVDIILGYDRSAAGVERVCAARGKELSCWERLRGAVWRPLAFPALGAGEEIDGCWVTEGDAWLHVRAESGGGRLLRLRPVNFVYRAGRAPSIAPVATVSDRLLAAPSAPAQVAATDDPSPFHDAVVSYPDRPDAEMPNGLHLCPMRGRTFVCGVTNLPLVSTDGGVVNDDALEARMASAKVDITEGWIDQLFGSWPGSAWAVMRIPASPERHAYRFTDDGWTPFAEWYSRSWGSEERFASWGRELFAAPVSLHDDDMEAPRYGFGVMHPGAHHASPMAIRAVDARPVPAGQPFPVKSMASDGDYLYVVAQKGTKLVVERRGGAKAMGDDLYTLADLGNTNDVSVQASLSSTGLYRPVVFGSITRAGKSGAGSEETPLLQRFDGTRWTAAVLPAGQTRVAAYERTSGGVERIFTYAGETLSFFERANDAPLEDVTAWHAVLLPTLPEGGRVRDVWLANDDAWLLVWPKDTTRNPPRLMRMQPVKRVWTYPRKLAWGLER